MQHQGWAGAPVILPAGAVPVMPLAGAGGVQHQHQQQGGPGGASGPRGRREPPPFIPGKVFLGGISNDTNEDSLQAYCGQWGEISDVHVMTGKGYAFVTFATVPTAQAFLEHREHYIDGRRVDAKAAVPKGQGGDKPTRKMFVGGIGEVADAQFRAHFANFGTITDCVVLRKPDGTSRGFGFVTYDDEVAVEKCLVMEHHLGGRRVDVKRAVNKEEEGGGGMGGGGMAGGGRGGRGGGGMGGMGGMQHVGGGGGRDAGVDDKMQEWVCAECGNTNLGWRHTCSRCKTRRAPGHGGGSGGGGMGGMGGRMGSGMGGSSTTGGSGDGSGMGGMGGMGAGMGNMPTMPGGMLTPAAMLSAGIIPANLVASMLQSMQGMPGMQSSLAAMGAMPLSTGMAPMAGMGAMAGMPAMMGMAGMPGMDAAGMGAGLPGGVSAMGAALAGGFGMNPAAMAGMAGMSGATPNLPGAATGAYGTMPAPGGTSGGGAYGAPGSAYGGFGTAGIGDASSGAAPAGGAGVGGGDGGYGRMTGGRGGGGGGGQRYRPY